MDQRRRIAQQDFDDLAIGYLGRPGADRAPMFGGFGLRLNGKFVAFVGGGGLIAKLPAPRAAEIVASGAAEAVRVGGRPTREWVGLPYGELPRWADVLAEAYDYLAQLSALPDDLDADLAR